MTERTINRPNRLTAELEEVRRAGYAIATAISVPVLDRDGRVVAAVSILGPESRLAPEVLRRYSATLKNEIRPLPMVIPDSALFRPRKG